MSIRSLEGCSINSLICENSYCFDWEAGIECHRTLVTADCAVALGRIRAVRTVCAKELRAPVLRHCWQTCCESSGAATFRSADMLTTGFETLLCSLSRQVPLRMESTSPTSKVSFSQIGLLRRAPLHALQASNSSSSSSKTSNHGVKI